MSEHTQHPLTTHVSENVLRHTENHLPLTNCTVWQLEKLFGFQVMISNLLICDSTLMITIIGGQQQ